MSEEKINNAVEFAELKGSLKRIEDVIMTIKEKNEEMAGDIPRSKRQSTTQIKAFTLV